MSNSKLSIEIDKRKERFFTYFQPPGYRLYRRVNAFSTAIYMLLIFLFSLVMEFVRAKSFIVDEYKAWFSVMENNVENDRVRAMEIVEYYIEQYDIYSNYIQASFIVLDVGVVMCLLSVIFHYRYLKIDGSNGLARLKRLPNKTEWFRRVWGLPLIGAGILLLVRLLVTIVCPVIFNELVYSIIM